MEVKPGYKQTEVGVIPEEWVVSLLADVITSFQNGFAFASHGYVKSGIPIVTMAQIGLDGRFNFTSESVNYWPTEAASALRAFQLFRGDIIIAMTDVTPQKNLIGRMAEVTEIGPLLLNQRVGLFRLDAKKIDPYFLRAMSNSSRWRGYARAVASLGVQANIGTNDIRAGKLPLPPLPEQRAIALALSDVDGLLGGLDRLIAKKRDLKQAAMQQLLTGQTRLPGWDGAWEETTLGELATFLSGGTPSRSNDDYWTGDIPWISASSLRCFEIWRSDSNVTKEAVDAGSKMAPVGSSLLLVRGSALHNEILCGLVTKPVCFNQDVKALVPRSQVVPRFLTLFIRGTSEEFLKLVSSAGNTAGVLDTKLVKAFAINLPSLPEQTAIASVLTEMDGELAGLEQRREKTRALKQAMMQELLTGRTRLL